MPTSQASVVMATEPATPGEAANHFASLLTLETDCADVNRATSEGHVDFVLLDVRSPAAFAAGHIGGARNLPGGDIDQASLSEFGPETTFVVYCAGPHCNGADKAALRLAELGHRVKKMIGGVTGWLDEGLTLTKTPTKAVN